MDLPEADGCAEWQVTTKGATWVMAKLVGNSAAAVTFRDIANTIDGGDIEAEEENEGNSKDDSEAEIEVSEDSLAGCGEAGGQMGVIVDAKDPLYKTEEFVGGGFTSEE